MTRVAVFGSLLAGVSAVTVQQAPQPTFRATADLVRLEVVVVDEQGRPVRDLTQADFTILDRKKPQPIALFHAVSGAGRPAPVAVRHTAPPSDVATNATARASTFIILVVDDMIIRKYHERTQALAREIVDRFGQTSVMAMLVTSGTDAVEATDDPAQILAAIDRLGEKAERIPERMGSHVSHATLAERHSSAVVGGPFSDRAGCHLMLLQQAAMMTIADDVARKILVYITPFCGESMGASLTTADLHDQGFKAMRSPSSSYTDMLDAMHRSNVTIYALDPRGELKFNLDQFPAQDIVSGTEPVRPGMRLRSFSPVFQSQEGLRSLTALTGGVSVTNSSDFEGGFAQLSQDLTDFYVLGFYPPESRRGEFRAIDVQVDRPGVIVRARKGYMSGDGPKLRVNKDPMVGLSVGALPVGDLPLALFASTWPSPRSDKPVLVVLEVTVPRADVRAGPAGLRDDLEVTILAARTPGAKLVRHVRSKRQIDVTPTTAESVTYQVSTVIDLPPASYQLRVSAKSAASGRAGSVYLPITVRKPESSQFALGGIVIGHAEGARGVSATASNVRSRLPFSPTLTRSFPSTDTLRALIKLWRRSPAERVAIGAELIDDAGAVVRRFEAAVRVGRGARATEDIDFTLKLAGLQPGSYRLRVTAGQGEVSDTREIGIAVRDPV